MKVRRAVDADQIPTGNNSALLELGGGRNRYCRPLGVVAEGALADLLPVDGHPPVGLSLIKDPELNFVVFIKDGLIYKSALQHVPRSLVYRLA